MGIEWTLQGADVVGRAGNAAPSITVGWSLRPVRPLVVALSRLTDVDEHVRSTHLQTASEDAVDRTGRVEAWDDHVFLKRSRSWRRKSEALYPLVERQKNVR
jgi:hypothetical protein